jgi:hypothetical protein
MYDKLALVRAGPVLVKVDALAGPKHRHSFDDRDRELRLGQRCPNVGWHIARSFILMPVSTVAAIGHKAAEKIFQISLDIRGGVLLDQKRCRGAPAPDSQQASGQALGPRPAAYLIGGVHEAAPARYNVDTMQSLLQALPPWPADLTHSHHSHPRSRKPSRPMPAGAYQPPAR